MPTIFYTVFNSFCIQSGNRYSGVDWDYSIILFGLCYDILYEMDYNKGTLIVLDLSSKKHPNLLRNNLLYPTNM